MKRYPNLTRTDDTYLKGLLANHEEWEKVIKEIKSRRDEYLGKFLNFKNGSELRATCICRAQGLEEVLTILGYHEDQFQRR